MPVDKASSTAAGGAALAGAAALAPAAGALGAPAIGSSGKPQLIDAGSFEKSDWKQYTGKASDSPKAREAYANVSALVAKFPTAQSLLDAGFKPNEGSNGTHWRLPGEKKYSDGEVFVGNLVTNKQGITTGAQMDTHIRPPKPPPAWAGVQWHFHDSNKAGWMFHIDVRKPIDEAFIQHSRLTPGASQHAGGSPHGADHHASMAM